MKNSVIIERYSFGSIVVNGRNYTSDILIIDNKVQSSWWRIIGHAVDVADVRDVLRNMPDYFLVGQGKPGLMKSTNALRIELDRAGIVLIEEPTSKAVETFNKLSSQGKSVAAGFHLTC